MVTKKSMSSDSLRSNSVKKLVKPGVIKNLDKMTPDEIRGLITEFEAYQSDLEMRNQALLDSNADLMDKPDNYSGLFDQASLGYLTTDKNGFMVESNLTLAGMLGVSRAHLINHLLTDFIAQEDREKYRLNLRRVNETGEAQSCELRMLNPAGNAFWVKLDNACAEGFEAGCEGFRTLISDISKSKQVEQDLKKISKAVESSSSAVIITDLEGVIEYINPKFTELTGYTREEAMGQTPGILGFGETPEELYADMWKTITSGNEWIGEFHNRRKDGSLYWARNSVSGVRDEQGKITHYIGIQQNVTHDYELKKQLSFQSSHDALTGLTNRREFIRRCERLLSNSQQGKHEHALCFMVLDRFEQINENCGHVAGYELLRQLGQVLQNTVRHRDTLARLNGDEFGVLIAHCSLDQAHRVATELLQAVNDYEFFWEEKSFRVGANVGLVAITSPISNFTDLLKQADTACYMARETGRNRIHVHHIENTELIQRQSESKYVSRINEALDAQGFCLYAQSIVSLNESHDQSVELLLRMQGENEKLISPGVFLPVASRYNLIEKVDAWVISKAMDLLAENQAFLDRCEYVSVNLTGDSLNNDHLLDLIVTRLNDTGIDPGKLCLELSEMAVISNLNSAIRFITILKDVGCQFALDDFGRGLSSFGYLKTLPVDYLKINGAFVKDIVDDPINLALVKSINEIGQVMGFQTIAEHVENDEILKTVREIGINFAQGYGIHDPQAFEQLFIG